MATEGRAPPIDVAALEAHLERRGRRLDPAVVRWIGHRVAAILAAAHAELDDEGNPAPSIHGAIGVDSVLLDADGDVSLVAGGERSAIAPELSTAGRLTPRADVYALCSMLRPRLGAAGDPELEAALDLASEPLLARRRVTCVELEALLARGVELGAAREALASAVRECHRGRTQAATRSAPVPALARVGIALATAAVVFAAGVAIADHWLR